MEKEGKMKQELKALVLNSKFLNLSIEDLKSNTNVPVEWHVEDSSNKENIRKLLPNFNILVSTSMDISWKNEAKNLKAIFMPGAGWDKIASEAVPDGCVVTNSYEHENGIAEYVLLGYNEVNCRTCMPPIDPPVTESSLSIPKCSNK